MQYQNGIWVFGYGSLIWKPGFSFASKVRATLNGYRRGFCLWSIHYRGNAENPGLVLGLDKAEGAHCDGVAYFVESAEAEATHAYLRERELVSYAYHEKTETVTLEDGRQVQALCYVVDRQHEQYAGGLSLRAQAKVIRQAKGTAGKNTEYLHNTARHLALLEISDPEISALSDLVSVANC